MYRLTEGMNMLVLSRKPSESVLITASNGEVIRVTYLGIARSGKFRLGFEAPLSVHIAREEIADTAWGKIPLPVEKVADRKTEGSGA